jgi:hypothetical protein
LVVGGNARDWQTSGAMLLLLLFHVPASLAGVSNVSASASSTCSCLRCSGVSFACKQQETHKHTHKFMAGVHRSQAARVHIILCAGHSQQKAMHCSKPGLACAHTEVAASSSCSAPAGLLVIPSLLPTTAAVALHA